MKYQISEQKLMAIIKKIVGPLDKVEEARHTKWVNNRNETVVKYYPGLDKVQLDASIFDNLLTTFSFDDFSEEYYLIIELLKKFSEELVGHKIEQMFVG